MSFKQYVYLNVVPGILLSEELPTYFSSEGIANCRFMEEGMADDFLSSLALEIADQLK